MWRPPPLPVLALGALVPWGSPGAWAGASMEPGPSGIVAAQAVPAASPPADSSELHRRARRLQNRFEALRRRTLPRTNDGSRWRECDEVVGRFCLYFGDEEEDEGDWAPVPDSPEILQARGDLLDSLSVIAARIPGDGWVVSQLVQYLGEEGRWSEALEWVDDCASLEPGGRAIARTGGPPVSAFARARPGWWCHALQGYVLHRSDRYRDAEEAFGRALERMHPDRRDRWLNPDPLLDGDADDVWDDTEIQDRDRMRDRLWALADPLHLLDGNDRLTEHFARHTVAWIREDAENPYGIGWGWDLEELVVRYGEEMGWNRTRTPAGSLRPANVVGLHHPQSRRFLPPGQALRDPTSFAGPGWGGGFEAEGSRGADEPTTAYAPPYAPDFRFEPFQIARFRRGEEMIVVAGYGLRGRSGGTAPPDGPAGDSPGVGGESLEVPDRAGDPEGLRPPRAGLFLLDAGGRPVFSSRSGTSSGAPAAESGALSMRVPAGDYLASVEVWDPATARAGRARAAVGLEPLPPDVAALSDLVILEPDPAAGSGSGSGSGFDSGPDSASESGSAPELPDALDEAIPRIRPVPEACTGSTAVVGWELTGVGLRREPVDFALRLEIRERGFFSRIGDFLGVTSPPEPLTLEWTEPGPDGLRPVFRAVRLSLPAEMEPGAYRLTLEARLSGRGPLVTSRRVEVREPGESPACGAGDSVSAP